MPAPTFVQEEESLWDTRAGTDATTPAFDVLAGDVLVAVGMTEDDSFPLSSPTGGSLSWTLQNSIVVVNFCAAYIWTATVDTNKNMTFAATCGTTGKARGASCFTFRGSDGIGGKNKENGTDGGSGAEPTFDLTTTQANSAIVICNADWSAKDGAGGLHTWRTAAAGAFTDRSYFRNASLYTIYSGYHADAGSTGAKSVGLTLPVAMTYSMIAVEVKGSAATPPSPGGAVLGAFGSALTDRMMFG